jgi:predicted GNAT family N-acyltransferase
MLYTIRPTKWQTDKSALVTIRTLVFVQEQQVSEQDEWDNKDETATHYVAQNAQGIAVGCARVLIERHQQQTRFHIGRVAVLKEYRQQGIGRQLMQTVINKCLQQQPCAIYLHAQTERINFYQQLDFVTQGDIFMDAGILHIEMWYKPKE